MYPHIRCSGIFWIVSFIFYFSLLCNYSNAKQPDSCLWIVTNRIKAPEKENDALFGSTLDPEGRLRYTKACHCPGGRWIYQIRPDFTALLSDMPGNRDIVINVHGDHKTFDEAAERGWQISDEYNVSVLLFTWPSELPDATGARNFKNSKSNVRTSAPDFYRFLKLVEKSKEQKSSPLHNNHITLFHHSLGNYFLQRLVEDPDIELDLDRHLIDNLVLNAAAVNAKNHIAWLEKLNFQKRLFVISNKKDFNLNGVRIFTSDGRQLGERLDLPLAGTAVYINFSGAVGFKIPTGLSHTYFIGEVPEEVPNIRKFYRSLFHGEGIDVSNPTMFRINIEGLGYDLLK